MTNQGSGEAQASSEPLNLTELRARAEFWTTRDPSTIGHLYDKDAVAFAGEVLALVDELRATRHDRDIWKGQVVGVRAQQNAALRRADHAEAALRRAQTYCARPTGVCIPKEPLA